MSTPTPDNQPSNLRQHLHDLCQPLTRLQWRLELGQHGGNVDELRETIQGALADALELTDWVRRIRATIENQSKPTEEIAGNTAQGRAA